MIKVFRDIWDLVSYSISVFAGMIIREEQEIYLSWK